MARMKIVSVTMTDFKSIKNKSFNLDGNNVCVTGRNASGKTTILTGITWLFWNVDADLKSNPNVFPIGASEAEPTVEAVVEIDGVRHTIVKHQKRKVGKPNFEGVCKVTTTNAYEINNVPKSERDFIAWFNEKGISLPTTQVLSIPNIFVSQKTAQMRETLFGLVKSRTDLEIAQSMSDVDELTQLLKSGYTLNEITAMQKATKKKADAEIVSIPSIILGMEKSKTDLNADSLIAEENKVLEEIESLKKQKKDIQDNCAEYVEKGRRIIDLQYQLEDIKRNAERLAEQAKQKAIQNTLNIRNEHSSVIAEINQYETELRNAKEKKNELSKQYVEKKNEKFSETYTEPVRLTLDNCKCPTCGQNLPKDLAQNRITMQEESIAKSKRLYEKHKSAFNKKQEEALAHIVEQGKVVNEKIANITAAQNTAKETLKKLTEMLNTAKECELQDFSIKLGGEEYEKIVSELDELNAWKKEHADIAQDDTLDSIEDEIAKNKERLEDILKDLSLVSHNKHIDSEISELREKQIQYEQEKANAEKVLYQTTLFAQNLNTQLTMEINSYFDVVEFELFEYLKNGNYSDICIPTINGKRFGESLNTGMEIIGKVDICNSLQKAYDCYLPILLDNSEALNDTNVPTVADTQIIRFKVTDDEELNIQKC